MSFVVIKHFGADVYGMQAAHGVALPGLLPYHREYREQNSRKNCNNCNHYEQLYEGKRSRFALRLPGGHCTSIHCCLHTERPDRTGRRPSGCTPNLDRESPDSVGETHAITLLCM